MPISQGAFSAINNRLLGPNFTHDDAGRLTKYGAWDLEHDDEGRLWKLTRNVSGQQHTTEYRYDGNGRRVMRFEPGASNPVVYVYDVEGNLMAEYGGAAETPGTYFPITDHLGSTRLVLNASGGVESRHDYVPFGEEIPASVGNRAAAGYEISTYLKQKFTGKERHEAAHEAGFDYFLARYYSSPLGRFATPDANIAGGEILDPQSWGMYQYARNSPLLYIDKTGLDYGLCDTRDSATQVGSGLEKGGKSQERRISSMSQTKMLYPIVTRMKPRSVKPKVGFIDRAGVVVVEPVFDDGDYFCDGICAVREGARFGCIDESGRTVIGFEYEYLGRSSEGKLPFSAGRGFGYIRSNGERLSSEFFQIVADFHEEMAWVMRDKKYGFLGADGSLVLPLSFDNAGNFSEGVAPVRIGSKWGYVRANGEFAIEPKFDGMLCRRFSEGLACVCSNGRFGYVNHQGEWVIAPRFREAFSFREGVAFAREGTRYGIIDANGGQRAKEKFRFGDEFRGALALVHGVSKHGFVNQEGEYVIKPQFSFAHSFRGDLAFVTTSDSVGYINRDGEYVWKGPWVRHSMGDRLP